MKSQFFIEFEKELSGTAQQKAEGFTLSLFDNMTDSERSMAVALLSKQLRSSNYPVKALEYIATENAIEALVEKWDSYGESERESQYSLAISLAKVTGDSMYLECVKDNIDRADHVEQLYVVSELVDFDSKESVDIFKKVLIYSDYRAAKSVAAKPIIKGLGVKLNSEEGVSILGILKGDDIAKKRVFLDQI